MKGNLRNRLVLIRELENRKHAAGTGVPGEAAPDAGENAALSGHAGKAPAPADAAPPLPGWESVGSFAARRTVSLDFPCPLPVVFPRSLGILAPDFSGHSAGPEALRFFDLETTGLSSGAGTVAFLAAFGRFVPAAAGPDGQARYALRVSQYLLLDYPGEGDFLGAALREFGCGAAETPGEDTPAFQQPPFVVTYNGKSFDAQILKTRCLMNTIAPPDYRHADLLHPARRLWKRVLPSCSQASVETAVLGLDRSGDIPGSEAPDIWFDFLKTGKIGALYGICDHNIRDIYGLARLMAALAEIAASPLEALGKYRCDAERLALRWWKACR
ncbi:MAG: ribonuclease H-like domain-containing protein, partial [Treponema sp.]|nr:ribonuclease H-like domain-containing protein [Treponema sp.]